MSQWGKTYILFLNKIFLKKKKKILKEKHAFYVLQLKFVEYYFAILIILLFL